MAMIEVKCPIYGSTNVIEYGKSRSGSKDIAVKTTNAPEKYSSLNTVTMAANPG